MVAPTTSYPSSTRIAAATELSTPPDMATRTRSFTVPPPPSAECGMRNAESRGQVRYSRPTTRRDARAAYSAFRTPHSALASSVQDGGQSPDLLHNLRQGGDERVHVFQRVLLAEREPQRRDAQLPCDAHGREHVRRFHRAGGAGRPRGAGDPREVQVHQQRLAVGPGDRYAGD